ncbi:PP2C family protein-serine/threonine phosphatase [Paracoccus spongiarum]|uniref:SpoIIE family protein phosphatase n=1 Tax=Paracoccus spongiarum TaxID=3064387 RepID=A0ABT9JES9_9RHOB|nr:SpoIIE family protein phosphatase [Paracoccus sp. 2205BS29-5]MDP5308328.1 SpoIIE family protein phosphatase [Paracoccus sp. 2205BS29-5]
MKAENRKIRSGETADRGATAPRRLLLVKPRVALRRELAERLRDAGYQVTEAASGRRALTLCAARSFEVVICDWDLPDIGGAAFCHDFRALERTAECYLLVLAGSEAGHEILQGLDAGADDFVTLPINGHKLLARLGVGERVLRVEAELRASNAQLRAALDKLRDTQAAIERDLMEARKLQQGLVRERSGRFGDFELSLLLRPAGHIGGDLVGFFPIGTDRIGLYALDVSGHGVTAALLTAQLSVHLSGASDQNVALRAAQAGSDAVPPAALAHFFNNMMLEEMSTDTYFTMIYAELNHVTGLVRMVQAGHPHPMLQGGDGRIRAIGQGGMPIGVFENPIFDEIEFQLDPGARLLIASDGITEAASPGGRQLGEEGLEAIMRTNAFLGGHAFLESMAWSVSEYCRGERPDDMSAVLIEYLKPAEPVPIHGR